MNRRNLLAGGLAVMGGAALFKDLFAQRPGPAAPDAASVKTAIEQSKGPAPKVDKLTLKPEEWRTRLTPAQFDVLRKEGTERPWTSPFNNEKRKGMFHCAGCDHVLFSSEMKYESGSGWPSFFTTLPGAFEKSTDFKMIYPRTEYHCAKCGSHHGHVFNDGPSPTGQRWCNNGVALVFKEALNK